MSHKAEIIKEWKTKSGYKALIYKAYLLRLYLCGYVEIPREHQAAGVHYNDLSEHIEVHGGLTYAEYWKMAGYYVGFDCNHYGDTIEKQDEIYVTDECEKLAEQLLVFDGLKGNVEIIEGELS